VAKKSLSTLFLDDASDDVPDGTRPTLDKRMASVVLGREWWNGRERNVREKLKGNAR
jgi:hypothetical protein